MNTAWFTELNLSDDHFLHCPEGVDPLVWALEQKVIDEETYIEWACNKYGLAALKGEFFQMAVDTTLSEKYSDLAAWNSSFYPIYEWQDVLYVACLEPQDIGHGKSVCMVIAPYGAMSELWQSMPQSESANDVADEPASFSGEFSIPATPQEEDEMFANAPEIADDGAIESEMTPPPPEETFDEANIMQTLTSIDFSSASLIGDSATSIAKTEPLKPEPSPAQASPPSPDKVEELNFSSFNEVKPSVPSASQEAPEPPMDLPIIEEDDDKTPPPVMASAPRPPLENPGVMVMPPMPADEAEVQLAPPPPPMMAPETPPAASASAAAYIPEDRLVNDSVLASAPSLEACKSIDDAILYLFSSLRNDFKKFMWIPNTGKGFVPAKARGTWAAAPATWTTAINIDKPNIFRIAYNSRMPFHGPIVMNDINQQYFAIWNQSRAPEHVTIYPICSAKKECLGFVVGAEKGNEFDIKGTLRKFDNLIELALKKLNLSESAKAS